MLLQEYKIPENQVFYCLSYELRFSYDRDDISRVALAYNGSSPANIYISQLCFYALIQG